MRKRLCKATKNKKTIPRADRKYQRLWEEMSGSIKTERLDEILSILEPLPIINKKAHFIRNRIGVCIETIGTKGKSKYIGIDNSGGVIYFDGNRLGKRKLKLFHDCWSGKETNRGLLAKIEKQCI